jgi:leader peptidase (prepilin peptidase)/N-methyltransferase
MMELPFFDFTLLPNALQGGLVALLGAAIGSFLNVCVSRWPLGQSVVWKRSHCRSCQETIAWYQNIPLMSYWVLKGKCARCEEPFSQRYFWVEAFCAVAFFAIWAWMPMRWVLPGWILLSLSLVASLIDLETFTLPNIVLAGGALLGLLVSYQFPQLHGIADPLQSLVHALKVSLMATGAFLWFGFMMELLFKKPCFGLGDAFWIGVLALFTGPWGAVCAVFGGAILGTLFIGIAWILERTLGVQVGPRVQLKDLVEAESTVEPQEDVPLGVGVAIPFGPWLALGANVYFWFFQARHEVFLQMLFR